MKIVFQCSNCEHTLQVDSMLAGKAGKCKRCGTLVIAPLNSAPSSNIASLTTPERVHWKDSVLTPSKKKSDLEPENGSIFSRSVRGIFLIITVLGICAVLMIVFDSQIDTPPQSAQTYFAAPPAGPIQTQLDTRWADTKTQVAPNYQALNITDGFRGVLWNSNLHSMNGFKLVSSPNYTSTFDYDEVFTREYDWPLLGKLTLSDIKYDQFNGWFYKVEMHFTATAREALDTFELIFGESVYINNFEDYVYTVVEWYEWKVGFYEGLHDCMVRIVLFPDSSIQRVTITYNPVEEYISPYLQQKSLNEEAERQWRNEPLRQKTNTDFYGSQ